MTTSINESIRGILIGKQKLVEASTSKKDYIATANAIKTSGKGISPDASDEHKAGHRAAREHIAHLMADSYGSDNPHFDRQRFLDAALKD